MFRQSAGHVEVFIARPGGPWFPNREHDVWTIPKGEVEPGEEKLEAAIREFQEEVGLVPHPPYLELGWIRQKGGKTIFAWAFEGDWDDRQPIRSNTVVIEWPPGSGRKRSWPEIARARFYSLEEARRRLKEAQHPLLGRLEEMLSHPPGEVHPSRANLPYRTEISVTRETRNQSP